MAALWWHSSQRQLADGQPIASFNQFLANIMNNHGFQNTHGNQLEAAGGKNNCWVSVGHFNISGSLYWEIVMGSAEDAQTAEATVNEVVSAFQGIGTL
jgi:hypothetical protein